MDYGYQGNYAPNVSASSYSPESGIYSYPDSPASDCAPQEAPHQMEYNNDYCLPITTIDYEEQNHWAAIAYHELNRRVGEIYQCLSCEVVVDGFTNPMNNTNRFCLGQLSNVNRNSTIEQTRRHIGKGLLFNFNDGVLRVKNLSDVSVFVQSRLLNIERQFTNNSVCKIPPLSTLVIFSNFAFSKILNEAVSQGFEVVYDMTKMCTIRISFVKGWGTDYHRQDVTATPCWIEIHMNGALKWLDKILYMMGSPQTAIGSVS